MKKLFLAALLFGLTLPAYADISVEPHKPAPPEKIGPPKEKAQKDEKDEEKDAKKNVEKIHAEYKDVITKTSDWVKNVTNEDFYKEYLFKNKKTGEKKKIGELPKFDREMFYLVQIERLNDEIDSVKETWSKRVKTYDDLNEKDKLRVPSKEDLENYDQQLHFWHKKLSARHKEHATHMFKTYKDEFTKEEADFYLKKLDEYQTKCKLGEEKKK